MNRRIRVSTLLVAIGTSGILAVIAAMALEPNSAFFYSTIALGMAAVIVAVAGLAVPIIFQRTPPSRLSNAIGHDDDATAP